MGCLPNAVQQAVSRRLNKPEFQNSVSFEALLGRGFFHSHSGTSCAHLLALLARKV